MHILRGVQGVHEGDESPVPVVGQSQARLFQRLPQYAVLRTLLILELAAHADPLVVVQVIFLLDPVEHQIAVAPLQITEGRVDHGSPLLFPTIIPGPVEKEKTHRKSDASFHQFSVCRS